MLRAGTYLQDRYEILELIGSGGMSDVYKAKCHKLNRYVAVKVLKAEFSSDEGFVSKFKMEAQAAACLSHPNIVSIYDVVDEGDLHYIVMELIEGITLKSYIAQKRRLDVKEAVSISIQVAQGIAAAHSRNIVHRDIKPQNIIISKDGKVKVADFGIARAATSQTITVSAVGSVHYISPEQARGGYSDARSDIYSFGITMYEMVTGRVPFEGDNTVTVALAHLEEPITRPSVYNPQIPVSLENIILKCTEKKPEHRYRSAEEVIADLRRVLIHPDENFVTMSPVQDMGGETVIISKDELNAIKSSYHGDRTSRQEYRQTAPEEVYQGDYQKRVEYRDDDREEYQEEYSERGSRQGGKNRQNGQNRQSDNRRRTDDRDDVSPQFEKIMTTVGVVVAIVIVAVLIVVFSKLGGLIRFGNSDKTPTIQTETVETEEFLGESQVRMPDVRNLYIDDAVTELKKSDLDFHFTYEDSETVEKDHIIAQQIEPEQVVNKGTMVELYVSNGTDLIDLSGMGLVGMDQTAATALLDQNQIKTVVQQEYSDTVEEGKVIRFESQNSDNPLKAKSGESVTLYVSQGPEAEVRTVPNIQNISEDEAIARLTDAQLEIGEVTEEHSDTVEIGYVISQSIAPETMVKAGDAVGYVVSIGPEGKRYIGAISETYQLSNLIGPGAVDSSLVVEVRLKQEVDGRVIYRTLMQPTELTGKDLLPISYPSIEGISGVDYGEVEVVNMQTGLVVQSYPVKFFETE